MIAERLAEIRSQIPEQVQLVAVSKFHPVESVREAYEAGQRLFGENRAQELAEKAPQLPEDIQWHFIGTLQRNKVKYIVPYVSLIESVDSESLLKEIVKQANRFDRQLRILLQYKIAQEESKSGLDHAELLALVDHYLATPEWRERITICGLMGMATLTADKEQIRHEFDTLRALQTELRERYSEISWDELSMGMSSDWPIAVEAGSTIVRIGTAIFGERQY